MNSDLIKYYLRKFAPLKQGGYYTYSSSVLNKTPIKEIDLKSQKKFVIKVDKLLNLNTELFNKKRRFLDRVKKNTNISQITNKIDNFYKYDFNEFTKELIKQKIKLTLKEQDEWEDYFDEYKEGIIKLQKQVKEIDTEINQMVYKLYGLTNEEIELIKDNYSV